MKISTQTRHITKRIGNKEGIKLLCEAGYDALDFSFFGEYMKTSAVDGDDYKKEMKEIRKIADSYHVTFNQTHAPFPSYAIGNDEYNKRIFPLLIRSIEASAILGANQVVIHPIALESGQKEFNIDFYQSLEKYAKEFNVKIALENMFGQDKKTMKLVPNVCSTGEEFADYLDALNPDIFVGCLDIGHIGIIGEDPVKMIHTLGKKRLQALHVHDNDNIGDLHTLPFTKSIDFVRIMKALKEIGYEGDMTLEADCFLMGFPDELLKEATLFMYKVAKELVAIYDAC